MGVLEQHIRNVTYCLVFYTFPVIREVETDTLENLLLSLQKDGSYSAFLVSYDITAQEKSDLEDGISIDLTNKVTFTNMDDEVLITSILSDKGLDTNISSKEACGWSIITSCSANNPNHPHGDDNGEPCPGWQIVITNNVCEPGSGGEPSWVPPDPNGNTNTNNGTNNNDPTNNGGTGTNNNDDPDVTSPTTTCTRDCPMTATDGKNCDELNKLLETPTYPISPPLKSFNNAIADLNNQLGGSSEQGFSINHNADQNTVAAPVADVGEGYTSYPRRSNTYGGAPAGARLRRVPPKHKSHSQTRVALILQDTKHGGHSLQASASDGDDIELMIEAERTSSNNGVVTPEGTKACN